MAPKRHNSNLCKRSYEWLWNDSDYKFPPIRMLCLLASTLFYFSDFFIDVFAAIEHYIAWKGGSDQSLSYFIATVVFIALPTFIVNLVSLSLYTWSYFVLNDKNLRRGYIDNFYSVYSENIRPLLWHRIHKENVKEKVPRQKKSKDDEIELVPMATEDDKGMESGRGRRSKRMFSRQLSFSKQAPTYESSRKNTDFSNLETLAEETEETDSTGQNEIVHAEMKEEIDAVTEFYPLDLFTTKHFMLIIVLHIFQVGFFYRVARLFHQCSRDRYSFDRYRDISFLRLIEAFLESAPQLLLQLYIIVVEDIDDPVRRGVTGFAVVISMISLSMAIGDYVSAGKDILYYDPPPNRIRKPRLSWTAYMLIILWNLGMIISRGIAISLFASEYGYYVFIPGALHYFIMLYWLYRQDAFVIKSEFADYSIVQDRKRLCNNYGIEFLAAAFNIFFLFKLFPGDSVLYSTAYHVLYFTENIIMILLWYVHIDFRLELWYQEAAPVTVFLSFFAGLCLMVLYYIYFQPKDMIDLERDPNMEHPVMTCTLNRLYRKLKD